MPKKQYLEAGQIVGTHGIRGEVRVDSWCDSPQILEKLTVLYFDEGRSAVNVKCRAHKNNIALVKIEGIDTVQDAAALRGRILYLDRRDITLEDGTYFIQDLLGLQVTDADSGQNFGTLTDISFTGANDVYHVATPQGKEVLVPAISSIIIETDIDGGALRIRPIKGLFDNEI
ncbi:MAG: ribosome maturation factor RimM [Oscillospiraceae bacterium]|jgi:16S rRNA processing protein RimM|nr:ribosome maturation factor RimM [Oscillospiraceae bacterium]